MQSGDTNGETVIEIEMEREIGSCILVFGYLSVSFVICQFVVRCSVREAVFVGCLVAFCLFGLFVCVQECQEMKQIQQKVSVVMHSYAARLSWIARTFSPP